MIGITYTGAAYTNVSSSDTTVYPSGEIGANTGTAGSSFTLGAKRVIIFAIVVRAYTVGMTFTLETHSGTEIAAFAPTAAGTISFGPIGMEINDGWRITQGATKNNLMVVWKEIA